MSTRKTPVADAPGSPGLVEPGASATGAATLDTTTVRRWKRYPEYRPSGADWLPQVPGHWERQRTDVRLVRVFSSVDPKALNAETVFHYSIPAIEETGDGIFQAAKEIDSNKLLLRGGELLVSKLNQRKSRVLIARAHDVPTVCSSEFVALKPHGCHAEFARYLFGSEWVRQTLDANVDSVTRSHQRANPSVITKLWVAWPPLSEQRAIAAFLDRETARIDALIGHKERLIALLEEKRQAVISHAVTRGLDPSAPLKDSGIPYWGQIPTHWQLKKLRHLVPDRRQIMYGIVLPGPHVDDGIPIVKGGNCEPGRLRLEGISRTAREIEAGYERSRLREGDIVYAIRGSIGSADIVPAELNGANLTQDAARIAIKPGVHPRWLLYAVRSAPFFAKLDAGALGATIRGINIRDLKRADLPCPEFQEQARIAEFLDEQSRHFNSLTERVSDGIARLQEYRTALISAAVTGQIDVRGEVNLGEPEA